MSYQNNTIEALKKLYVAMGGTAADVENLNITPEMISAIADIYQGGGGGSDLPAVTADDNGKLLTVVEGNWDKAIAQAPVIYATFSYEGDNEWACDRTAEEVIAWVASGRTVIARLQLDAEGVFALLPVTGVIQNAGSIVAVAFSAVAAASKADVREVTSAYIGYSALGISCSVETGYLSATDPNV